MSNSRRTATHLQRARHWRPSAKSLAAAAAASGDPGPLLAVETYEPHDQPVARPDGLVARCSSNPRPGQAHEHERAIAASQTS